MNKTTARKIRHNRIRKIVQGTTERPRLVVFRSLKEIYGQIIDDQEGKTLLSSSSLKIKKGSGIDQAKEVGKKIAEEAVKKGIKTIVFDRNGYKYHGRVKTFAEAARSGGLKF